MRLKLSPYPIYLEIKLVDMMDEGMGAYTEYDGNRIKLKLLRDNWDDYLVHEIVHVIQFLQEHIHTDFDKETYAYFAQWLYDRIERRLRDETGTYRQR